MKRLRRLLRPQSFDQLDRLTAALPVQQRELMDKLAELQRMLGDRFDAEAEATDILHQVVAGLRADIRDLSHQLTDGPGVELEASHDGGGRRPSE